MSAQRGQLPSSWAAYERGRADSTGTDNSLHHDRIHFQSEDGSQQSQHDRPSETGYHSAYAAPGEDGGPGRGVRRRTSSMGMAMKAVREAGGVNSFENFARSWQRAVGFHEITPVRQSFRYAEPADEDEGDEEEIDTTPKAQRSLLRQQIEARDRAVSDDALEEVNDLTTPSALSRRTTRDQDQHMSDQLRANEQEPLLHKTISRQSRRDDNIFLIEPSLASPFGGSYGSTWGSLSSRVNESSMRHAGRLFRQQQTKGTTAPDKERDPLLVTRIEEEDGTAVNVVVGQSTLPQTIFNSVNVLIGVGLLALPLAMNYAGWIPGLIFFFFAGISTCYTAKLLAKCADVDSSLITFADLAYVSFGPWARIGTSIVFSLELLAACVALIVLFADSLDALIPGWGLTQWKVICGIILIPLSFVPLRYLSFTSILGILSCFGIVLVVLIDGLIKPTTPGSLREPAPTHLFPANWATLPISFGILMSPWGGHSVFPNIYRDMRHPYKYRRGVNITYGFTFTLDLLMAVVGLLMFGDGVKDEVTRNILSNDDGGYPAWTSVFIVICIAIIPLTKVPLNARPIVATLELFLGLDARAMGNQPPTHGLSGLTRGILKVTVRILCVVIFVLLAILIPAFDTIMSLLGAVACFTICLILPCAFHLKLFGKELSARQKMVDWSLIVVSTILALVSTAFNFVPKAVLGMS
ncbi:Vacuolar amino acid transporter 1 [Lecanosticta acicola]|uniref:Vacuolar amino acid transporter 1 n=1 Tax=Lecanosticta acicola TaxID=111012 RepID=A0AAI8YVX7_9PEZI|nr:Vacuolar amino acid transporter 1 [Lecanosticta acicola]